MESKIQLQKDFGSLVKKFAFLSVLLVVSGGGSNTSRWQDTWTNLLECSILNLVLTLWKMIQVTLDHPADCCPLKVSKFQKQIFLFSFEPNYFLISALIVWIICFWVCLFWKGKCTKRPMSTFGCRFFNFQPSLMKLSANAFFFEAVWMRRSNLS